MEKLTPTSGFGFLMDKDVTEESSSCSSSSCQTKKSSKQSMSKFIKEAEQEIELPPEPIKKNSASLREMRRITSLF